MQIMYQCIVSVASCPVFIQFPGTVWPSLSCLRFGWVMLRKTQPPSPQTSLSRVKVVHGRACHPTAHFFFIVLDLSCFGFLVFLSFFWLLLPLPMTFSLALGDCSFSMAGYTTPWMELGWHSLADHMACWKLTGVAASLPRSISKRFWRRSRYVCPGRALVGRTMITHDGRCAVIADDWPL